MKLQKREKILLAATAGSIVLAGLVVFILTGDSRPYDTLLKDRDSLDRKIQEKESEMKAAAENARLLKEWRRRSLPRDPVTAQALYQGWLRVLCDKAGLRVVVVHSETLAPYRDVYTRIPFTISARANLDEIVAFLHGFYSAGHLQQITRLKIKPLSNSRDFDLHVSIDALALRDADSTDKLAAEAGHELRLSSLAAYRESIGGRNFFAVYVPPAPRIDPAPPKKLPSVDAAKFAVVTAITQDKSGTWRVWLQDRMGRKEWQLQEGDQFQVGGGTGQVRAIDPDGKVKLQFDGKLREFDLRENLREGKELKE